MRTQLTVREDRFQLARLFGTELIFFGIMVPGTVLLTVVGSVVGVISYPSRIWRGDRAYSAWWQIAGMWRLVFRHIRFIFKWAFVPAFRREVDRQRETVRHKITQMKERARAARTGLAARRPRFDFDLDFEYIDGEVLLALLPQFLYLAVLTPHMVIVLIGTTVSLCTIQFYGVSEPRTEPVVEVEVEYEPQIADQQEADYGPWFNRGQVFDKVNDPNFTNIALLSDVGSAQYSQAHAGDLSSFTPRNSERVVNAQLTETGQINFKDQHRNQHTVNPGQVFLFENYKAFAFVFDEQGNLMATKASELNTVEVLPCTRSR